VIVAGVELMREDSSTDQRDLTLVTSSKATTRSSVSQGR
jgi:hypothetical protein